MRHIIIKGFLFFILLGVAYQQITVNPFTMNVITVDGLLTKPVSKSQDKLLEEIKEKSQSYEEPPQNAVIDKVWKKTPGRNGIQVNVQASFDKMKKKGEFDESLLVFDQVQPSVSIDDLPPSPIYRGHPEKNMVSFLINVAWGTDNIPSILHTLKEHNVKATFFIEGKWASNNTKLVRMIQEEGHIIGNHAYNHPDMNRLSVAANREQMKKTNDILEAITGEIPKFFAPPSGSFNDMVVESASELGMETILWSVDTIDWQKPTTTVMINRVMSNIHPGATILMHPTDVMKNGLEELILNIKQKEYNIGNIERLLSEKR